MLPDPVLLRLFADAIRAASSQAASLANDETVLPTAATLARQFHLRLEKSKKLLRTLRNAGLIRSRGLNPKRYWFDAYAARLLDPEHPLYEIVTENSILTDVDAP